MLSLTIVVLLTSALSLIDDKDDAVVCLYTVLSYTTLRDTTTLCEMCGDPSDEMDHRLAIEVARALGPAAMLRAFTPENLRWLCRSCHRRKTRQDRQLTLRTAITNNQLVKTTDKKAS